jgi:hypothetical protein
MINLNTSNVVPSNYYYWNFDIEYSVYRMIYKHVHGVVNVSLIKIRSLLHFTDVSQDVRFEKTLRVICVLSYVMDI